MFSLSEGFSLNKQEILHETKTLHKIRAASGANF